jgi:hypothetical protein
MATKKTKFPMKAWRNGSLQIYLDDIQFSLCATAIRAALSLRHVEPGLLDFAAQPDTENLRLSVSHPVAPNDRMIAIVAAE